MAGGSVPPPVVVASLLAAAAASAAPLPIRGRAMAAAQASPVQTCLG